MYIFYNRKRGYYVTGSFTDRLLKFIHIEGVNQNTFQNKQKSMKVYCHDIKMLNVI